MTTTPGSERRMRHPARRAQLLDVAERLFIERGYAAVTMEDIVRAAGVSRPMVYRHFGTREGVYLACVERAREEYARSLVASVDPESMPREQLAQGAQAFFAVLEASPGRWLLLFGSSAVLPTEFHAELTAQRFSTIEFMATLVRSAVRPDVPDARVQAFAHAMSGVGERLGHWWIAEPSMALDELVEHFLAILWSGLSAYAR